jgi:hypothetical protein
MSMKDDQAQKFESAKRAAKAHEEAEASKRQAKTERLRAIRRAREAIGATQDPVPPAKR